MKFSHLPLRLFSLLSLVLPIALVGCKSETDAVQPTVIPILATTRPHIISPQVYPDRRVTFRSNSSHATAVEIWGDWPAPNGGPMVKEAGNVWSLTVGPIPVGLWSYNFKIDGEYTTDPGNPSYKLSNYRNASVLELPGNNLWDRREKVAHGVVHLHDYHSTALGTNRRLRVYTPPGYDSNPATQYPVLYLFHGSGDNESSWTEFGRANVILDNLIAEGRAVSMIVVMPDGEISVDRPNSHVINVNGFSKELFEQVLPLVESQYRIRTGADTRAIAGLSMGANQALIIGLKHPESFAWVGSMSSAIFDSHGTFSDVSEANHSHRLIWISCGVEDRFLPLNRSVHELLLQRHIQHQYFETPGKHAWPVWRDNLIAFSSLIFKDAQ